MLFKIPFLSWSMKAALEIEIPDDTEDRFRMRAAVQIAIKQGSNLSRSNLSGSDLSGSNLSWSNLSWIKNDFWDVLLRAIPEVPVLLETLRAGRIDGTTYTGECACLAGTIANTRHIDYGDLGFADSSRPIECFFLGIKKGHTPETNQVAKIVEGWIVEFQTMISVAQSAPVA